jgi:two-component sensor histidine kinase
MASLGELIRLHTDLDVAASGHLHRLVSSWGMLADFCFADLLLFVPQQESDGDRFVIVAQRRPTTSQTLYRTDHVGVVVDEVARPLVARCWRLGETVEGEITITTVKERASVQCLPVRYKGDVIAVLTRESAPWVGRQPGELERIYLEIFARFGQMISEGEYPFGAEDTEQEESPRVGDGVVLLDEFTRVAYASPNAVSSLHRAGVHANTEGMRLSELGFPDGMVRAAFAIRAPVTEDIQRGPNTTLLVRCIPLIEHGSVTGAVVLMRDISDVRRRDLLLLSKDATIREIHHRVKNNLQTISSLLRLQGRRLASDEAKAAIEESVRRIRSIALVHESLARGTGEDVAFGEIVRELVRGVGESLVSPDRPVRFEAHGEPGLVPAEVATPLAVALNELLQNAVDHAFPAHIDLPPEQRSVWVDVDHSEGYLVVKVTDNGIGVSSDFRIEDTPGLGLSIVRTLVTTELHGTITMVRGVGGGTVVEIIAPTGDTRPADLDPA